MNELIRELVEALEYSSDFLSRSASRFDDVIETLAKARAYLETGGWTRVEDGLPVVPDGDDDVEVWIAWRGGCRGWGRCDSRRGSDVVWGIPGATASYSLVPNAYEKLSRTRKCRQK
jgi:hypothetical protein